MEELKLERVEKFTVSPHVFYNGILLSFVVTMSSDSKKSDKFLINVVPTFIEEDESLDFNGQYNLVPENFIQKYRLRCVTSGTGLLAATSSNSPNVNGSGSVGSISSPVAPSLLNQKGVVGADSMTSVTSDKSFNKPNANVQVSPSMSATTSTTTTSVTTSVQNELKEARAEIERLKAAIKVKNMETQVLLSSFRITVLQRNGKMF